MQLEGEHELESWVYYCWRFINDYRNLEKVSEEFFGMIENFLYEQIRNGSVEVVVDIRLTLVLRFMGRNEK